MEPSSTTPPDNVDDDVDDDAVDDDVDDKTSQRSPSRSRSPAPRQRKSSLGPPNPSQRGFYNGPWTFGSTELDA